MGAWEARGGTSRAQFKFSLGKKKQHFCGLRWLQADISKFLPTGVSYSWKNLFGQTSPGLVAKSGCSKMELKDRGSFPYAFRQGLSSFLTPCTALWHGDGPQAPGSSPGVEEELWPGSESSFPLFLNTASKLASSKSPFWFSRGSGFLGRSERAVYILDRVSLCRPCWT